MHSRVRTGRESMLGKTAVVIRTINPEGKVQYATEICNAIAEGKKFLENETVVISGFSYGLRLIVKESPGESNWLIGKLSLHTMLEVENSRGS